MKTNNITIREFRIDDYDDVIELWGNAGIHYKPNGRESRARIEKEIKSGQAVFLVAAVDNRIVGVVLGTHDGRKGWINRLAVTKEFRRQNIASKLVSAVEAKLNKLGIEIISCLIEPENDISRQFFNQLGYTKVPVEYYSKKQSADV
jgi:N-acetylglutamate synthase